MENPTKQNTSNEAATRRHFDRAFKQEAVAHWKASGKPAHRVANELGIRTELLYKWNQAGGLARAAGPSRPPEGKEALEAEVLRLRAELARITEQRDILKKAAGILCETPRKGMPAYKA